VKIVLHILAHTACIYTYRKKAEEAAAAKKAAKEAKKAEEDAKKAESGGADDADADAKKKKGGKETKVTGKLAAIQVSTTCLNHVECVATCPAANLMSGVSRASAKAYQ
jgi:hypothetical protein